LATSFPLFISFVGRFADEHGSIIDLTDRGRRLLRPEMFQQQFKGFQFQGIELFRKRYFPNLVQCPFDRENGLIGCLVLELSDPVLHLNISEQSRSGCLGARLAAFRIGGKVGRGV
jgi:hypothetical protein